MDVVVAVSGEDLPAADPGQAELHAALAHGPAGALVPDPAGLVSRALQQRGLLPVLSYQRPSRQG